MVNRLREESEPVEGLRLYTTPSGVRVAEVHWWARPDHDKAWMLAERKLYVEKDWKREQELDWSSPAGDVFLPEFNELGGRDKFVHLAKETIQGPIFRSYDFGHRRPAATWFQYHPGTDRVWAYREFMPHDLQTHEFRDAVRFLSGELDFHTVPDRAKRWVDAYAAKPSGQHCPPPWFPLGSHFIDVGGKEALQGQANAVQKEQAVARDIFLAGGIALLIVNPRVEGRYQILRRLLRIYEDGYPGLIIDSQMQELIEGFEGGLAYPQPSERVPIPTKPKNDEHYINLFDAFGYGISAVVPLEKEKGPEPYRLVGIKGREELYSPPAEEVVLWRENRQ